MDFASFMESVFTRAIVMSTVAANITMTVAEMRRISRVAILMERNFLITFSPSVPSGPG